MAKHNHRASSAYEQAITTDRPAGLLAKRHGFKSVKALANILPENAKVLDVGAGASPFGREVALLRPDITWTNFDYGYYDPAILKEVSTGAPKNLKHVAGDATELSQAFKPNTFDAVFSFWLLPHLSIEDMDPARDAGRAMYNVAKENGIISVGPSISRVPLPRLTSSPATRVFKDEEWTAATYADMIAKATRLAQPKRYFQKYANEASTSYFGTTRYARRKGRQIMLYHPKSGEYVPPVSRKAAITVGLLLVAFATYAIRRHKHAK